LRQIAAIGSALPVVCARAAQRLFLFADVPLEVQDSGCAVLVVVTISVAFAGPLASKPRQLDVVHLAVICHVLTALIGRPFLLADIEGLGPDDSKSLTRVRHQTQAVVHNVAHAPFADVRTVVPGRFRDPALAGIAMTEFGSEYVLVPKSLVALFIESNVGFKRVLQTEDVAQLVRQIELGRRYREPDAFLAVERIDVVRKIGIPTHFCFFPRRSVQVNVSPTKTVRWPSVSVRA